MLSFFARGVLDEILNLIESVSEDFPSYSCVWEFYQSCSNYDPGLTLTHFTPRSNLVTKAFVWEKLKKIYFLETIAALDL